MTLASARRDARDLAWSNTLIEIADEFMETGSVETAVKLWELANSVMAGFSFDDMMRRVYSDPLIGSIVASIADESPFFSMFQPPKPPRDDDYFFFANPLKPSRYEYFDLSRLGFMDDYIPTPQQPIYQRVTLRKLRGPMHCARCGACLSAGDPSLGYTATGPTPGCRVCWNPFALFEPWPVDPRAPKT